MNQLLQVRHILVVGALVQLAAQLALLAGIVDVVGSLDSNELKRLRQWSEYVAPVGFALLIINYFVISDKRRSLFELSRREVLSSVAVAAISFAAIVPIQRQLVTFLSERSSPQQRKAALIVMSGWTASVVGETDPIGLGISRSSAADVQGRVATLLLPTLLYLSSVEDRIAKEAGRTIAQAVFAQRQLLRPAYEARMGDVCAKFESHFAKYREASERADSRWFGGVVERAYKNKRTAVLGRDSKVELGLARQELIQHPEIQARARHQLFSLIADANVASSVTQVMSREQMINALNLVLARQVINPCLSWEGFERQFLAPLVWRLKLAIEALATSSETVAFSPTGVLADHGKRLVELAIVPPLSTFWILLSSALTVITIFGLACRSYLRLGAVSTLVASAALFGMTVSLPFLVTNRFADTARFAEVRAQVGAFSMSTRAAWSAIEWVMRGVPSVYPVGRHIGEVTKARIGRGDTW